MRAYATIFTIEKKTIKISVAKKKFLKKYFLAGYYTLLALN